MHPLDQAVPVHIRSRGTWHSYDNWCLWENLRIRGMSSSMADNRGGRLLRLAARLVGDENLDLYILAGAAPTFTVLGEPVKSA